METETEALTLIKRDYTLYQIGTRKSTSANVETGLVVNLMSSLKIAVPQRSQLVSEVLDPASNTLIRTDILNKNWPKGKISLCDHNNHLFALLEAIDGITIYIFNLKEGFEEQAIDLLALLHINSLNIEKMN